MSGDSFSPLLSSHESLSLNNMLLHLQCAQTLTNKSSILWKNIKAWKDIMAYKLSMTDVLLDIIKKKKKAVETSRFVHNVRTKWGRLETYTWKI